jgi:hypothetical protein
MTDAQVSNVWRMGFTVGAVAAVWLSARGGYWDGYLDVISDPSLLGGWMEDRARQTVIWVSLALGPSFLLCLSDHKLPLKVPNRWTFAAMFLVLVTVAVSYEFGEADARNRIREASGIEPGLGPTPWLDLLVPLIPTTAFVFLGAWRSAVRNGAGRTSDHK